MIAYYLDSSALIKHYVTEVGSRWLAVTVFDRADALLLSSRFSVVEVRSGLARRRREAYITSQDHADALDALREDGQTLYRFVEIEPPIVDPVGELLDCHPLRAYDALQLASALAIQQVFVAVELPGPILLSSDDRLLVAARAEGMQTDNPNAHA